MSCFRYHKGTDFQANHNLNGGVYRTTGLFQIPQRYRFSSKSQLDYFTFVSEKVVLDTTKVQIFKQITTDTASMRSFRRCFRYHKGTDFQANHNRCVGRAFCACVVLDTTKVQIFKQITTVTLWNKLKPLLFQIPQRYRFSSKSQRIFR